MKKLITLLLVLGFSMPVVASEHGQKSDDSVKCEDIFQGTEVKNVPGENETPSDSTVDPSDTKQS